MRRVDLWGNGERLFKEEEEEVVTCGRLKGIREETCPSFISKFEFSGDEILGLHLMRDLTLSEILGHFSICIEKKEFHFQKN